MTILETYKVFLGVELKFVYILLNKHQLSPHGANAAVIAPTLHSIVTLIKKTNEHGSTLIMLW